MTKPRIGKRKTTKHQRSLWEGGRLDLRTSTVDVWLESFNEGIEWKGRERGNILKTMMSRINTMNPITPPPEPYFHALPCPAVSMG